MMEKTFDTVITPKKSLLDFNFKEIWKYRDLIVLFVKRTFILQYKQTILGPVWAIIQPLFTTVIFTVVFGNLAGLAPNEVPAFVFYLCGSIAWTYFSQCLSQTSVTFRANAGILGKVYFPRLVMPISTVLSQLISFAIQFSFFLIFWAYYWIVGAGIHPSRWILMTPVLLLHLAALSLGVGIIVSALTTKYRDLALAVDFCIQLWMYATPVAYDMSIIPEKLMNLYMLNPVTPIICMFRYAFLGVGELYLSNYLVSVLVTLGLLFIGLAMFNKVEKTFMDTI